MQAAVAPLRRPRIQQAQRAIQLAQHRPRQHAVGHARRAQRSVRPGTQSGREAGQSAGHLHAGRQQRAQRNRLAHRKRHRISAQRREQGQGVGQIGRGAAGLLGRHEIQET